MALNLKWQIQTTFKEEIFRSEIDKKLEQIAQIGGGYPIPENLHGQVKTSL